MKFRFGTYLKDKVAERKKNKSKDTPAPPESKEKSKIPQKAITYTSRYYFTKAKKIWELLLISLPLDLLLLTILIPDPLHSLTDNFYTLLLILVCICFFSLIREPALNALMWLDKMQTKTKSFASGHTWIAFAVVGVIAFLDVIHRFGWDISSVLIALLVAGTALLSFRKTYKEQKELASKIDADRGVWIENMNFRVFLLTIIPLISARLVSVCGVVIEVLTQGGSLRVIAYVAAGGVLLLTLEPKEQDFMIACRRCGMKTSQALKESGLCPRCEQDELRVLGTSQQPSKK